MKKAKENLVNIAYTAAKKQRREVDGYMNSLVRVLKQSGYPFLRFFDRNGYSHVDKSYMVIWNGSSSDACGYYVEAVYVDGGMLRMIPKEGSLSNIICPETIRLSKEELGFFLEKLDDISYTWDDLANPSETIIDLLWTVGETLEAIDNDENYKP